MSNENRYIQSAKLNGKKLSKPWFYHSELVNGGELELIMGKSLIINGEVGRKMLHLPCLPIPSKNQYVYCLID